MTLKPALRNAITLLLLVGTSVPGALWAQKRPASTRLVPAAPPDTVPAWIYADSNLVADSVQTAAYFYANVIVVRFEPGTPQADRQAAIEAVGGEVVGGRPYPTGEGIYYVRLDAKRRIEPLRAAGRALRKMPQIAVAAPVYRAAAKEPEVRKRLPAVAPDTLPIDLLNSFGEVRRRSTSSAGR